MTGLLQQIVATSYWEWCAVLFALAYLILAIRESIWCWPAAFFSTSIYAWLFFDVNLFMESLLNAYYLLMAIYGWNQWSSNDGYDQDKRLNITTWTLKSHVIIIISLSFSVLVIGQLLMAFTSQDFAYLDSFTTLFALVATFMVTKKVLENWLYWIVINIVSIYLFASKGLVLTALLFVIYVILAILGWIKWSQQYKNIKQEAHQNYAT
ncbi:MAG: nicotinamide riboside transporter PnuC [Kangiellaceae bacterium]